MLSSFGLRKTLVSTALGTLRTTGAFQIARNSRRRREKLLILCYHGLSLSDEHEWQPNLYMSGEQFRERLELLRRADANVLPLGEALSRLDSNSLPPRSVAITFDDGFYDFAEKGAPALADFGYPATVYLTTHYTKYSLPIPNLAIDYFLWKSKRSKLALPEYGIKEALPIRAEGDRRQFVRRLHAWMNEHRVDTLGKDDIARSIAKHLTLDYDQIARSRMLQILNPSEVRELAKSGIDFQLHTHRHRTPADEIQFAREIRQNREAIYDLTGKLPVHFCYPSGNVSDNAMKWLRECNVQSATTCERGLAVRQSQRLRLPRVLDDATMTSMRFESVVSGLLV